MQAADQHTPTRQLNHLVGGKWQLGNTSEPQKQSTNPANASQVVANYHPADTNLLHEALNAAEAAKAEWDRQGLIARGLILRRAAEILKERQDEAVHLMTFEEGKPLADSKGEVGAAIETLYYQAAGGRYANDSIYSSAHPDEVIRTIRRPLGTVGVITPWNFPLQIPVWKIAPALLWGNTVVWKPASETPAMAVLLAEVFVAAGVPAGVLNLLLGPGTLGEAIVTSDQIDAITFTGSVPVGRSISKHAAERGTKIQLELGGHNAAIVLPDADPAYAAAVLVAGAMSSTGQKCTATRRIIAVGEMYDALVPEIQSRVQALQVGAGAEEGIDIGPLVSSRARDEVDKSIQEALTDGAKVLAQSDVPAGDAYVAPTVLAGSPELSICNDEVFGPVTTMLRSKDLDEAISIANMTAFGLTASIISNDEVAIRKCVNEIDAGLIKANSPTTGSELHVPFGGLKDSSFPGPREQNAESSADFFTRTKSVYLRTAPRGVTK